MKKLLGALWAVLLVHLSAQSIPVIYCTDLFHPHEDPDDHFDLATLFAMPEFEIKAILLDQGLRQKSNPGSIPLGQLLHLTGRKVPFAAGLSQPLSAPSDDGAKEPQEFQEAVALLLKALREAREPVTIITTGSVRDVCAAWNREPALLKEKVARLYLNIGSATQGVREYNVDLDPNAFLGIMRSGLPIYWCPCLPMHRPAAGADHSTWWRFRQKDVLAAAPIELQRFFIYALQRSSPTELDPIDALVTDLSPWSRLIGDMERNMWCTASFLDAAGRILIKQSEGFVSVSGASALVQARNPFSFVSTEVEFDDQGRTIEIHTPRDQKNQVAKQPGPSESAGRKSEVHVFTVTASDDYVEAMRDVMRQCLGSFPLDLLKHTDVFASGQGGYSTYRIPAIEMAPNGTLIALAEARKYNAADPGFGRQDIDLVCRSSRDGGATWTPMTIIEDPGELWSAANPATLVERTRGRVWVFYLRSRPGRSTETSRPGTDDMQTIARWTEDGGQSWSDPMDLTTVARDMQDSAWRASVPGPGGAVQTRTGRMIVPIWKYPFANLAIYSDDQGQTWHRSELVPNQAGGDENQIVELPNGRLLMDIRQNSGAHRWVSESADGGQTWSIPRPGQMVTPVACAVERVATRESDKEPEALLWTGPKGPDRRRLILRVSRDQGESFDREMLLSDSYAAYSDLTVLSDGSLGVLWERGADRGYQFVTFTRVAPRLWR